MKVEKELIESIAKIEATFMGDTEVAKSLGKGLLAPDFDTSHEFGDDGECTKYSTYNIFGPMLKSAKITAPFIITQQELNKSDVKIL